MGVERSLAGLLLWCLAWVSMVPGTCRAEPPGKDDSPEEPKKLNVLIEKSVNWYDVLPDGDARTALTPVPVIR